MSSETRARIAFIAGEFPKASETFVLRELRALRERGLDFVVVATRRLPDIPEAEGIEAEVLLRPPYFSWKSLAAELRFAFSHPLRYVDILTALYRGHWRSLTELTQVMLNVPRALAVGYELRRRGITRVHALWANLPATLGYIIARGLGMDFSFSAHAWDVFVGGRMLREKTRLARHVVVCSRAAADHLEGIVGTRLARKISLVHHGIEADKLPPRLEIPGNTVLAAGRLVPKKGFDVLIRACALLRERGRDVRCVIVGDGPLRGRLEDLAARTGATNVELRPWMHHDALMHLVAEAAVVVVPSVVARSGDRDGIPNIILEAMAIGTPVVATDSGGIAEVVRDGQTAFLVAPGQPAPLADRIGQILDKKRQTDAITGSARELIRRKWTLCDTISALERLLTDSP